MSSANKERAAEVARALMHSEGMTAAEAAREIAPDFGLSAETIRRAALDGVYAKEARGNLHVRIERLEQLVAEMSKQLTQIQARVDRTTRPKLSREQLVEMRQRYAADGTISYLMLAAEYGVTPSTVAKVIRGRHGSAPGPNLARPKSTAKAHARLTEQDVREVRHRLEAGDEVRDIADAYGVTVTAIYAIKARRSWKDVE